MTINSTSQSRSRKAKGREAENAVCEYLRARGLPAERRRLAGEDDLGDIGGISSLVVEVKNHKQIQLGPWIEELTVEVGNANGKYPEDAPHTGILVAKRKGKPWAGDWYAVLRLEQMVDLLLAAGWQPS